MSNNYKVYNKEGELILSVTGAACFSGIRNIHNENKGISFVYELKSGFAQEQINQWYALCNELG